jgi:hypothetical protein
LEAQTNCMGACLCGDCRAAPGAVCRLEPVADTYVEGPNFTDAGAGNDCPSCGEAKWDHGRRDRFDIDGDPRGVAYLKFNLKAVDAAEFRVKQATLRLFSVNNPSVSGIDFYRLRNSDWIEGQCDGIEASCTVTCDPLHMSCAGAPLRFVDVDTNGDGIIDGQDTSSFLPNFATDLIGSLPNVPEGESDIDVTSVFAGREGIYSLVIDQHPNGTAKVYGDGSTFASRDFFDATAHPILEVRLACTRDNQCPASRTSCHRAVCNAGDCDEEPIDPSACTACSSDANCADDDPCTTEVCGDPEEGCIVTPVPAGFPAVSCALQPYSPPVCAGAQRIVKKLDEDRSAVCRRLKAMCDSRPSKRSLRRALKKAKGRLARGKSTLVRALGRINSDCGSLLDARLDLGLSKLEDVRRDRIPVCEGLRACPPSD